MGKTQRGMKSLPSVNTGHQGVSLDVRICLFAVTVHHILTPPLALRRLVAARLALMPCAEEQGDFYRFVPTESSALGHCYASYCSAYRPPPTCFAGKLTHHAFPSAAYMRRDAMPTNSILNGRKIVRRVEVKMGWTPDAEWTIDGNIGEHQHRCFAVVHVGAADT